jgi:multidrug efflux system membrane fusion protein
MMIDGRFTQEPSDVRMLARRRRFDVKTIVAAAALAAGCTGRAANAPQRVPVSVARVERRAVPFEIGANGTVEAMRTVEVLPQVTGTIVRVRFDEGDEVAAGQILFEIDPRPYQAAAQQAEANLLRDLAQAENAARDAERYRELATTNTVTKEDYQQKQATADALAATVQADSAALAVAHLNLEYATIRAPIPGRTGRLVLREGNVVRPGGEPLVTINQLRPILVRFSVPAAQLPELRRRAGQPLRVLASAGRDSATAPADGLLSFMDNQVDSTTGTLLLKARFPNRDGALWPGEFVDVTLVVGVQTDATVVPAQAVMTGQQGTYVFVVNGDGRADQRAVTVTRTLDSVAVLADRFPPGTLVVTDGQLRLTPESRVEIRTGPKTEPAQQ